jgi:hypothetical protein
MCGFVEWLAKTRFICPPAVSRASWGFNSSYDVPVSRANDDAVMPLKSFD